MLKPPYVFSLSDLAVDYVQRQLYLTNRGMALCNGTVFSWHRVEMVKLGDRSRYTLTNMAAKPHALSLDLTHGYGRVFCYVSYYVIIRPCVCCHVYS